MKVSGGLQTQLHLSQHMVMTPQLQLAIKILAMNRLDLDAFVSEEMASNPLLEEENREAGDAAEEKEKQKDLDADWEAYRALSGMRTAVSSRENFADEESADQRYSRPISLADHLLWQAQMSDFNWTERAVAEDLIGNMNDDGYLDDADQVIEALAKHYALSVRAIHNIRNKIMQMDPAGCLAIDVRESLLAQLKAHALESRPLYRLISRYFEQLGSKNVSLLAKQTALSEAEVLEALHELEHLEPKPGRAFSASFQSLSMQHIIPDVIVVEHEDNLVVLGNDEGLPRLQISHNYLRILAQKPAQEAKRFLNERLKSATWLIRAIYQRQKTIVRVAKTIVQIQKEWFMNEGPLKPLILKQVAEALQLSESTISRVTSGKYLQCSRGVVELKSFFHGAIAQKGQDSTTSVAIQAAIKKLVQQENPQKPLSDAALVRALGEQKISIARRTVAKYREELGISASSARKNRA